MMVSDNSHLTRFRPSHYDPPAMKRVASGILPMIAINRQASKALRWQIYDAFRTSIVDGSLHPGQRIPSTRVLASELGVSRARSRHAPDREPEERGQRPGICRARRPPEALVVASRLPPTRANGHVKGSSWGLAVPGWRTFPAPSASSVACCHETSGHDMASLRSATSSHGPRVVYSELSASSNQSRVRSTNLHV
jgi:DNA-binding transcriptional MocR family regulator